MHIFKRSFLYCFTNVVNKPDLIFPRSFLSLFETFEFWQWNITNDWMKSNLESFIDLILWEDLIHGNFQIFKWNITNYTIATFVKKYCILSSLIWIYQDGRSKFELEMILWISLVSVCFLLFISITSFCNDFSTIWMRGQF